MAESRNSSPAGEAVATSSVTLNLDDDTLATSAPLANSPLHESATDNASLSWSEVDVADELDGDDSADEQIVLDPEHPLMVRFQGALKIQLQRRLAELDIEERELNVKLKCTKTDREELGMTLYSEQQDLALVQAKLESLNQNLQTHTAQRFNKETEMENLRKFYKTIVKDFDTSRQQASTMQKELNNINIRIFCMMGCQSDVRSDVKVMKRAALKTRMDLTAQEKEKQIQDYRVDLLVELIDNKQSELEMFQAQTSAQKAETQKFKNLLAEAEMELEVLCADIKQIHSNWTSTLLGMRKRDEALSASMANIRDAERELLSRQKEIDAFRRNISQSEEKHEKLTYTLTRINNDIASSKKAIAKASKRFDETSTQYTQMLRVLYTMEEACTKASSEKATKESQRAALQTQFEQLVLTRNAMKEEMIDVLQSHSAYNKATSYTKKTTSAIVEQIASLEKDTSMDENALATLEQALMAVEMGISCNNETLSSVQVEIKKRNSLCASYESIFKKNHVTIERKQNMMDDCNKQLAVLLEKQEGNEVSPLENLVINLTKSLRKESNRMLDDQTMWVEKQQEFLNLVKEKHQLDISVKHRNQIIFTLNGKRRKFDVRIVNEKDEKHYYELDMRRLRVEMERLASLVYDKKEQKETMEASSYLLETDFIRELKEFELDMLKMKDRVVDLDIEKESLLNQLVQLETQVSWWQKKIQLGTEMKETIDPKKNSSADTSSMKCEIHRMAMRYQSLMKEQERLIRGMENTVTRREYVITSYKAKVRRDPQVLTKSKCNRRIYEAKGKIVKFKKEMEQMDEERKQLHDQISQLGAQLDRKKEALANNKEEIGNLEMAMKKSSNSKYKNLNELVRRQKKLGYYNDIQIRKYKLLHTSTSKLTTQLLEEQRHMEQLAVIIDRLKAEFPDAALALDRVICCYGFAFDNVESSE